MAKITPKPEAMIKFLVSKGYDEDEVRELTPTELKSEYNLEVEGAGDDEDESDEDESDEDEEETEEEEIDESKQAVIINPKAPNPKRNVVRTYTYKLHGKNFQALAESFVAKFPQYKIKEVAIEAPKAEKKLGGAKKAVKAKGKK